MMHWIVRMIGDVLRGTSMHRQPSAIALAIAFGLAIGMMPKDNLMVVVLVAAACFLQMNYLLAIAISLVLFFTIPTRDGVPWTDGATHIIGKWMLEAPLLQSLWGRIAQLPILPWLRWNNSVVLGSVGVGLASFLPMYFASAIVTRRFWRFQSQNRVDTMVQDLADYQTQITAEQNKRQLLKATIETNTQRRRAIKNRSSQLHRIDDTVQSEVVKPNIVDVRPEPARSMMVADVPSDSSSAVLHETVIEIVRYRPKNAASAENRDDGFHTSDDLQKMYPLMPPHAFGLDAPQSMNSIKEGATQPKNTTDAVNMSSQTSQSTLSVVEDSSTEKPREEALRYLLWHLSGMHRQPTRPQEPVS